MKKRKIDIQGDFRLLGKSLNTLIEEEHDSGDTIREVLEMIPDYELAYHRSVLFRVVKCVNDKFIPVNL